MMRHYTAMLAATLALATAAGAATVPFTASVLDGGPFAELTGTGTVTFDEGLVEAATDGGFPRFALSAAPGPGFPGFADFTLDLTLDVLDASFDASDDIEAPAFPAFVFEDGVLVDIEYVVADGVNGVDLASAGIAAFSFETVTTDPDGSLAIGVAVVATPIPLPASLPILAIGLATLGLARRRLRV